MTNGQRLFLGSAGLGAVPDWLGSLPEPARRALLIPTAANPMPSAPWVDAAEKLLRDNGIIVDRLDLERVDPSGVERAVGTTDLVYVAGGYPLFLLDHVRRTGFARLITSAVRRGRVSYIGISAGAALAAPDLAYFGEADAAVDPGDPGGTEHTTGLDLVPFLVLAHRNRGRAGHHDRQLARNDGYERISINDDQAVVVDGDTWSIVESL